MHTLGGVRCGLVVLVVSVCPAFAGFIPISQLTPFDPGDRTARISGLAFDGQSDPWIIDSLSWQMQRINAANGSVLETYSPQPAPQYNDSLAWSSQTGLFYTANQFHLYSIGLGSRTILGPFPYFNFASLAFDPAGNLWLGVDDNMTAELWRVDASSGQLTLVTSIAGGLQFTALAIDSSGGFYISVLDNLGDSFIYKVDPTTGAATWITAGPPSPVPGSAAFLVDFEQQPGSGRWFGIEERRGPSGYTYYFGEITGMPATEPVAAVPEPGSFAGVALTLLLIMCGKLAFSAVPLARRAGL